MAGRILNRRDLRKQADSVHQSDIPASDNSAAPTPKATKTRAVAAPQEKKRRAKKAPPRMRARWGIFDGSMKQVAVFDYNQLGAAQEKLADLQARKKGIHIIQIVKEPMEEMPAAAQVDG